MSGTSCGTADVLWIRGTSRSADPQLAPQIHSYTWEFERLI